MSEKKTKTSVTPVRAAKPVAPAKEAVPAKTAAPVKDAPADAGKPFEVRSAALKVSVPLVPKTMGPTALVPDAPAAEAATAAVARRFPPKAPGGKVAAKRARNAVRVPVMSMHELARLGGGRVAYIKVMTTDEARAMFPAVEEMPTGVNLYALHAADGTPLALTDSMSAAMGQAIGDELEIASLH